MKCLLRLLAWISLNLRRSRRVCSILEALRLRKVIVLLGAIQVVLRPIFDCSILCGTLPNHGLFDLLDSLFDSEAVFLGSLVILGGFVAMGQRVKNILDV